MLGAEIAMASILESITSATEQGGLTQQDFASMHVGLALAGAEHKASWQAFMSLPHPFASMTLNTDAYGACVGAHNGEDGAIMIAGPVLVASTLTDWSNMLSVVVSSLFRIKVAAQ